jgi:hypothetical protein
MTCCRCCCCCCCYHFTAAAAKDLHDTHHNLPKYTALLHPCLGEWTLPLLALLLHELQARHGKGGRAKEGDPRLKDPDMTAAKILRRINNREAAARSKLKVKIANQVSDECVITVVCQRRRCYSCGLKRLSS